MTMIPPAAPQPHDPANPPPPAGADEFRLKVETFWEKNRSFIFLCVLLVLVAILGREAWQYYRASQERAVQEAYAKVERVEDLPKFAEANRGHTLAGVALLRVADAAYEKNDFRSAATTYQKAADELDGVVALKTRARLGAAMSQLASGDTGPAETALKALKDDTAALATLRAEAAFHLATLAHDAGRTDEATQLLEEVSKIEANGLWAQRAFALRAQMEMAKPAAPASDSNPSGIEFKPGGE